MKAMQYMSIYNFLLFALIAFTTANHDESNGRIVDGEVVSLGEAPYMASLTLLNGIHFCGGTIISQRTILTAAQCTIGRIVVHTRIVVGTVLRSGVGGTVYIASGFINHPAFNPATLENDIALIISSTVIVMTPNVQTAYIEPRLSVDQLAVHISGWGINSHGTNDPISLQGITTRTISNENCRSLHKSHNQRRITKNKICTSVVDWQGICYGDEGGALVSEFEIIGVASWHSYCAAGVPDIYERVAPHRLWIRSNMVL